MMLFLSLSTLLLVCFLLYILYVHVRTTGQQNESQHMNHQLLVAMMGQLTTRLLSFQQQAEQRLDAVLAHIDTTAERMTSFESKPAEVIRVEVPVVPEAVIQRGLETGSGPSPTGH